MKLIAIVPVHTSLPVAGLTIGSFLRSHRRHDVEVHVGVHSNYRDYTADLSLFDELKGVAEVHKVDEIDWLGKYNECFFRYSVMHAKNVENLLRQIRMKDFDYAVLLDHDLHVKEDFVTKCLERHRGADLIGCLQEDKAEPSVFQTFLGYEAWCLPKISAWHLLMSRRFVEKILEDPQVIYPQEIRDHNLKLEFLSPEQADGRPLFIDTFSLALHRCRRDFGMRTGFIPLKDFAVWVRHFFASSFNYGARARSDYAAHLGEISKIYAEEFPIGLQEFREEKLTVRVIHENLLKILVQVAEQHATITLNDTVDLPAAAREREIDRLGTALMTAKAMCVSAGIREDVVRTVVETVFQKEKQSWVSNNFAGK